MRRDLILKRRRGIVPFTLGLAERSDPTLSFDAWAQLMSSFAYGGVQYTMPNVEQEEIGETFSGFARAAYKSNGVVFACMAVRQHLFSQIVFKFRNLSNGDLHGSPALLGLEEPEPKTNTRALLARMLVYADLGGNWFGTNRYGGVRPLRPDWMTLIIGSDEEDADAALWDPAAEVVGYSYLPGGPGSGEDPIIFLPEEIAHFAPLPDPEARFRGMSWLTPVVREIMADKSFTEHKLRFTEQGATPNMLVKFPVEDVEKFMPWIEKFREQHEGAANSFKTLFLGAGMDASVIGTDFQTLDLRNVQGAGETRIAAAARVPATILGISEGLQGSTLNAGNYNSARRQLADELLRDLWCAAAGALSPLVEVPSGSELWYDDRQVYALQEDAKDAAEVLSLKAQAVRTLTDAGYTPESAIAAVETGDLSRLVHTGLFSVQLQKPGATDPANSNGNGNPDNVPVPA